ncbi:hypothetical protein A176_005652 [Myxococcus hansupus]|uniref:Outer membrane protein beta-barrel domain-containing protein n=1 Tax=Pseudomyxococcus hansupus TaxID=1297742 RepID=A0A0H4X562_9BACT|nr:hypothetical protein [Myxococcus hansupus]AKQ68740.1 hypothetical protein A176_005652 [Myxococcus hansupus]
MASAPSLALLVLALAADAQARPEEGATKAPGTEVSAPPRNAAPDDASWEAFPGTTAVPQSQEDAAALPRMPEVPPLVPVREVPLPEPEPPPVAPPPPRAPNRVSLLGAQTVGAGGMAAGLSLGFPSVTARVALGLARRVDALVGLDSVYGLMNELRVGARWRVLDGGDRWSLGLVVEGSHAFFLRPASVEERGARHVSGRRNWNVLPGIVGSFQFAGARAPRLFLDARYLLALDTEPVQGTPLGGLPPDVVFSSAFPLRVGAEVPVSEKTSYAVTLGGDIRTRPGEANFMPVVSFGVVTGF